MGFRFWRRMEILPGITLNISKSGVSFSFGVKGLKYTVGPKGRRTTLGIPGTGLSYTKVYAKKSQKESEDINDQNIVVDGSITNLFKQLTPPEDEKAFIDGCKEFIVGNYSKAFSYFERVTHIADGLYLAGFLALKNKQYEKAIKYLEEAVKDKKSLGNYVSKYGIVLNLRLSITEEVSVDVGVDEKGALLGLVEAYQTTKHFDKAILCLNRLLSIAPDDIVVKLSLAELLLDTEPNNNEVLKKIITLSENISNKTYVHTALLFYRAKALRLLGLKEEALKTLTTILRKKKDRPKDLLKAIMYERACVYEEVGQYRLSRREFKKLYDEDPYYEDVSNKLGINY